MTAREDILNAIEQATGTRPRETPVPISGGCIHEAFRLGDFFIKTNHASKSAVLETEKVGLLELSKANAVKVPEVICSGTTSETAFLVLEYLDLVGSSPKSQAQLGTQLAELHRATQEQFGFSSDNFIGETPQPNKQHPDWITFWREQRLEHMGRLLTNRGQNVKGLDQLLSQLDGFLKNDQPTSSLLHGDLWGGNASALVNDTPVIYDPAVYYGDRETDLAMTTLFGGFSNEFYQAYEEVWPLDSGYPKRRDLYNLYHILNHAVLFGGGYLRQAETMIASLLN